MRKLKESGGEEKKKKKGLKAPAFTEELVNTTATTPEKNLQAMEKTTYFRESGRMVWQTEGASPAARSDLPCATGRSRWDNPAGAFAFLPFPSPSRPAELISEASEQLGALPNAISEMASFGPEWNSVQFIILLLVEWKRFGASVYQRASFWSRAANSHGEERLTAQLMPGSAGNTLHAQHSRLLPSGTVLQFSSSMGEGVHSMDSCCQADADCK
ncbi:uncharacterized protein LOC122154883 [Tyto alba]|uniref:uncharacterized protein LOC122154883 n=1 Tax=Tyto alba TaxID=56313 RepID=UPI001C66CAF5|nr:uncharacterized protein LOC122154883 [Tyto alba]